MSQLDPEITHLRQSRQASDGLLRQALRRILTRQALSNADDAYLEQAHRLLEIAEPRDLSHVQLARIKYHNLPTPKALSFRTQMVQRWESSRIGAPGAGWQLDRKRTGYAFADNLGVRRPKADLTPRPLADLSPGFPAVVKAGLSTGARGLYLCFSVDRILHLQDGTAFGSWDDAVLHAHSLMKADYRPLKDSWLVEEMILEAPNTPARDLKFYAFYGQVELVLEVVRHPRFLASWWGPDGSPADTGKYQNKALDGVGVTKEQIEHVESISREIPRPFMRIDMLRGEDEIVLGEFTPRPGGFEQFNAATDRRLGEAFARAEHRLMSDLLGGKRFDAFRSCVETR